MNPYQLFAYVPLSVLRILARFVAWIILLLPSVRVNRTVSCNLKLAYPDLDKKTHQALYQKIIVHQCLTSVESVKSWAMPPDWSIRQIHTVHHQDILTKGLNHPNGMLAIIPHLGTWEMMNAWLNQFGAPTIMYKPVKGEITNDFVLKGRQRLHAKLVPTDGAGVKAMFKTLKAGGFSIILPDHVPEPSGGVVVPFFGIPTLSSTLAVKLASKTHCALVGLSCIRRQDGQGFDVFCYDFNDLNLYDKDSYVAATALNNAMQTIINQHKEHYMWGYRRFKHVPDVDGIYELDEQHLQQVIDKYHHSTHSTHRKLP